MTAEHRPQFDASGIPLEVNPEGPLVDIGQVADDAMLVLYADQIPDNPESTVNDQ